MEEYLQKNYKDCVESITLCTGIAKTSGNQYYYINLKLINGYEKRIFVNNEQMFAFKNAFDLLELGNE